MAAKDTKIMLVQCFNFLYYTMENHFMTNGGSIVLAKRKSHIFIIIFISEYDQKFIVNGYLFFSTYLNTCNFISETQGTEAKFELKYSVTYCMI